MKRQAVFIIMLLAINNLFAQGSFTVKHYNMDDGLAHNMNKDVIQDSKGYIWLSTWNGIDKFDGYNFLNFKSYPHDKVKLPNNRVEGLYINSHDNFWVRTYGQQLFLFNRKTEAFEEVFSKGQSPLINTVKCLENGVTWAISENSDLYRIDERNYHRLDGIRIFGRANYPYLGKTIHEIFLDSDGDEWILSNKGVTIEGKKKINNNMPFNFIIELNGVIYLASQNGYLATYTTNGNLQAANLPIKIDRINRLKKISDEVIAIVTPNLIILYNTKDKSIQSFSSPKDEEFIASEKLFVESKGVLWTFASGGKIVRYDIKSKEYIVLDYPDLPNRQLAAGFAFLFYEDVNEEMWILLREGFLCTYNESKKKIEIAYYYDSTGNRKYYAVSGRNYMVDTHNNLWITTKDGFDQISFNKKAYERIIPSSNEEVRAVFQDKYNRLWLGLKDGKVEIYDEDYNYIGNLNTDGRIIADNNISFGAASVYCFYQDTDENIWMGSRNKGLFVLSPKSENQYRISQYQPSSNPYSISSLSIYNVFQDSQKRMWVGCFGGGLNLAERDINGQLQFIHAGNEMKNYPVDQADMVRFIYQSKEGVMMVGTTKGLITFSGLFDTPEEIAFFRNFSKADCSTCLSNNDVLNIYQDRNENIYISTFSGGIDITSDSPELLSEEIHFKNINKTNGLASDLSLSVVEDKKGFIWVAAVNVFNRLNPATGKFDHFDQNNLNMAFRVSEASPIISNKGDLIYGTINGTLCIHLDQIQLSSFVPPIVFTGIRVQQKERGDINEIQQADTLMLDSDQRNVTIRFAALDYSNPEAINYAYQLKGNKENDWIYIGKNRSVDFINLPAGEHILQVKSTNSDGVWVDNVASICIIVKPTFWETGFAWIIYVVAFILLVMLIVFIITYILNLRRRVDFEQELTRLKLKFFTDISHELRTPLTLITSPLEEVISNEILSETGNENMRTVKHNADRMLRLINQILDFRKIQNNKMKVYLEQIDVMPVIEKVFQSFYTMAYQKQIHYIHQGEAKTCQIYTDADKVEKILFNLLSNAFKHTPNGNNIVLTTGIDGESFFMKVKDEGSGFDMRKVDSLFNRFETNNDADPNMSSGIGLSLVKELVNLLHGKIEVESTIGFGSSFSVLLPMNYEVFAKDQNVELILNDSQKLVNGKESEIVEFDKKDISILIIEDNDELRHFIKKVLSPVYRVLEAPNGKVGLELTIKESPDLVVSDIMMPEMDGIAYLNEVKNNHEISHIPVVLLSAKSSIDDQIKGMEYGADDYVTKPFSANYLKTKIATLIKQRELLREYYISEGKNIKVQIQPQPSDEWESSLPQITSYDDEFICKVIQSIEENIDKTDFKIETIAENLNMSRPVFYRKIKAIIGLSPIDFVKKIRVKRALQLLDTEQFSIAEVAYQSGFTTPQYLSKVFKEIVGCSPSEYIQNQRKSK